MCPHNSQLEGVHVLNLSSSVAGAYASWLLGGTGARIVLVEQPGEGNLLRKMPPFLGDQPHHEKSLVFSLYHRGAKSITLDTNTADGRAILEELLQHSDVLIEDFSPDKATSLGLDPGELQKRLPALVAVSITPFGRTGPYASHSARDLTMYAASGKMFITGDPEREPLKPWGYHCEIQGGAQAALGALVGVFWRELSGEGQHVDVSIVECVHVPVQDTVFEWLYDGTTRRRWGNRMPAKPGRAYPDTTLPCKDGYVRIQLGRGDLEDLALIAEEPKLLDDRLRSDPRNHADEIDALLLPWLMRHTKREAVQRLQELQVLAAEVADPQDLTEDPHYAEREFFVQQDHPFMGSLSLPGAPMKLHGTPWQHSRAPLLGEDNYTVYCQSLGYSQGDLVHLREAGII